MSEDSDEILISRYVSGDASAFETLFCRYKDPLFRFVLGLSGQETAAEELIQDTWLSIIKARRNIRGITNFKAYLYKIARNKTIDYFRKYRTENELNNGNGDPDSILDVQDSGSISIEQHNLLQECIDILFSLLEKLPTAQREVIILREETQMTLAEIALTLGVNHETLKSRVRYALRTLRAAIPEECLDGR